MTSKTYQRTTIRLDNLTAVKIHYLQNGYPTFQGYITHLIRKDMAKPIEDSVEHPPPKQSPPTPKPKVTSSAPEGYWNCPHCDALNEDENRTGLCSSCHKEIQNRAD